MLTLEDPIAGDVSEKHRLCLAIPDRAFGPVEAFGKPLDFGVGGHNLIKPRVNPLDCPDGRPDRHHQAMADEEPARTPAEIMETTKPQDFGEARGEKRGDRGLFLISGELSGSGEPRARHSYQICTD